MLVGIGHRARVGKDTCAHFMLSWLRINHGKRTSMMCGFADEIKAVCYHLYGWAGLMPGNYYEQYPEVKDKILPKLGQSPRDCWIAMGECVSREVFVGTWFEIIAQKQKDIILIKDLRRAHEADEIKKRGGILIKISNTRVPVLDNLLDAALDSYTGWDYVLNNESDLKSYNQQVETLARRIFE